MRTNIKKWAAALFLAGLASGVMAAPVGRVLLASGDVSAERSGQRVALSRGAEVQEGDVLRTGERSALQVRFNDESMASLRANTELRVDAYQFNRTPATDKMNVSLVKGGLRTVTGLIGKANQDGFGLKTATATIGIRGTHFTALHCQGDCSNPDGTPAANGTYGGVTDGRIGVSNATGERGFAQQEYFYVSGPTAPPQRLLAPPGLLSDRNLQARGRTQTRDTDGRQGAVPAEAEIQGLTITTTPQPIAFGLPPFDPQVGVGTFVPLAMPNYISEASFGNAFATAICLSLAGDRTCP